jgi:hypothetical protein
VAPDVRFWPAILAFLGYDPGRSPRPSVGGSGQHVKPRGYLIGSLPARLELDLPWHPGRLGAGRDKPWVLADLLRVV